MDIFQHIKSEHDKFRRHAQQIKETTSNAEKTRKDMYAELRRDIITHHKAEEVVLVPVLEKHSETKDMGIEIVEEHDVLEHLISKIDELDVTDEKWGVRFGVFNEILNHHFDEEEVEITIKGKEVIDEDKLKQLSDDFADEHKRQKELYDKDEE